ncbi:MAG: protease family protein [Verrucomicrobiota bacterium]|jgi:membrane protease YdiL (CAAX protease family)
MSPSAEQQVLLPKTLERNDASVADATDAPDPLRRAVAWGAMLIGSAIPNIISRLVGNGSPYLLPVGQTVVLVVLAILADKSRRLKPLTGFILTIAIVRLGWFAIAPMLNDWPPVHDIVVNTSWGAQQFIQRLLLTAGALLLLSTFIGRRFTRQDLFLRVGNLAAPARPEPILWFRRPIPWTQLGPQLLVIFGVALPIFLFITLRPDFGQLPRLWQLLPWGLATAALNAANEEFQFRCVPLAHLRNALPQREALWLTAIFFGLGHYFGQPSGPVGVLMATMAGWIWGKSMVETRGMGWAFGIHMVQDVVIFCFLAMSLKS